MGDGGSDRLTALEFSTEGLPPSASFAQVLAYDPADFEPYRSRVEMKTALSPLLMGLSIIKNPRIIHWVVGGFITRDW